MAATSVSLVTSALARRPSSSARLRLNGSSGLPRRTFQVDVGDDHMRALVR